MLSYIIYDIIDAKNAFIKKWFHSSLSLFGVVVAVASIIILISISEGAKKEMIESLQDLGFNTIRVNYKSPSIISEELNNLSSGLTLKDYESIKGTLPNSSMITPLYFDKKVSIFYKSRDFTANLYGGNENFFSIEELEIMSGRPMLKQDLDSYKRVAIVSFDLAKIYNISINSNIIIENQSFIVIGISKFKDNLNSFILTPYTTYPLIDVNKKFSAINIYSKELFESSKLIENLLLKNHLNIKDFEIVIPYQILKQKSKTQNIFSFITLSIAIMSLLSGGIGVMNIMLSNIAEQTREIGLRIAIGATNRRIMQQYLIYTIFLTSIGGLVGTLLGYISLITISFISKLSIVFSIEAFFIATIMSFVTGIIFGIYPALRAKSIEPMSALREY